jgi:hypothetical protein
MLELVWGEVKLPAKVIGLELGHQLIFGDAFLYEDGRAGNQGFALSGRFWISMIALLAFGIGQTLAGTTTITLLQTRVPEQMRGRVMSLNTLLIMGIRPLGDFPAGALIAGIGAPGTVLLSASLVGIYGLGLLMRPAIRST